MDVAESDGVVMQQVGFDSCSGTAVLQLLASCLHPVDLRLLSQSLRTFGHKLKHYLFVNEP